MSEASPRKLKKIDFLKSVGSNPDRRVDKIGAELGLGRTACYQYLNEFVENAVLTDSDADFPRKLLLFYNKDIPENEEHLNETDVDQLKPYIDQYYQKHLPGHGEQINTQEDSNRTMSSSFDPSAFQRKDMSTDEGLLRGLLENAKFVHPSVIDRFMKIYDINKENWNKNPIGMLEYMKHVFTNQQGEEIFKIFQQSRGKFVFGTDNKQPQGMDPMMLMMMMGGGNINPAMIPMMMNGGGGDQSAMLNAMMISQMSQKSAKDQQKQEQNEMFEKLVNTMMLKMVGGSLDDKKPMYDMMGMGAMMGPPTMREVLDEGGRVKARDYIPNFGGMAGQQQHGDPMAVMMMGKLMDANTQLMMKTASTGETPMNLLLGLIPHFKDQGNSANQLSSILQTMNQIAPGFFERRNEPQGGLEVYKLKFDTELAMQAQKIELAKMEHTWEVDKMDRQASNDNAKNWMSMIGTFGEKIVTTVGPAIVDGFGKGMLNKGAAPPQQQMSPAQMQQIMQARQMQAAQQAQQQQQQQAQQQPQQTQPTQQQPDLSTIYLLTNLQNALNQSEKDKQMMMQQIQELQNQPARPQPSNYNIDERRLASMPSGQLQEILQELNMENQGQAQLKARIEAVIANRVLMNSEPQQQAEEQRDESTPDERTFQTGNAEAEEASSEQTSSEEEKSS